MKYEVEFSVEWFSPTMGTPIVSVADYGVVFNKAAIAALNNPHSIRMGFDKNNRIIVVQAVKKEEATDETITFSERERNGFVRINNKCPQPGSLSDVWPTALTGQLLYSHPHCD